MSDSESVGDQKRILPVEISENVAQEKLVEVFELSGTRSLIAVDLDDVLCQTSKCAAEWHNRRFGTDMQIEHFYCQHISSPIAVVVAPITTCWQTRLESGLGLNSHYYGEFYNTDQLKDADPVPGSLDALNRLHEMGYQLVIVTARLVASELESTLTWVDKHFNGIFCHIVFSSQHSNTLTYDGRCIGTTLNKLQISEQMQSVLLIDDSLETALHFGRDANRPYLLFGDYEWNKRVDTGDSWTFDNKLALESGKQWWKDDTISLRSEDRIWRVRSWEDVLQWLKDERE